MILSAVPVRSHMELQEQVDDLLATIDHNGYHLRDFLEPEEIAECITEENGEEVVDRVADLGIDIKAIENPMAERLARAENALNAIARSTKSKSILSIISSYRSKTA